MLTVYRSNRAELLAQVLAAQLRLSPPDPFEQVEVVVNTWPTSRWLGEQLAIHLGGIAAHLRFPFPGAHLRRLVTAALDEDGRGDLPSGAGPTPAAREIDPWRADQLVWPLLDLLPSVLKRPEAMPLRDGLPQLALQRSLDGAGWQLVRAIADAFDDYGLYRPDLLAAWDRGRDVEAGGQALPDDQRWQPLLYRALRRHLEVPPFGLRVERTIERLRRDGPPPPLPRQPLRLFGISSLAPVQVELLQALSGWMPVDLFLLTPCRDLWQRCVDRRARLSDSLALHEPLDADWLLEAPGLEARFGRLGAEFQQLLEGTGAAQLGTWGERDLFFAPATVRRHGTGAPDGIPAEPPLLAQLQEQLADSGQAGDLMLRPGDHSLEFHPCPGQLRQVQILRDRLLQLLAADPTLEPRDILVMTPQVERFAPMIASVFGDTDATGIELPWRLTDRSQQGAAGIGRCLLTLLRQAGERLTASGLEALLDCRPLQERFGLTPEEVLALHASLQDCGFRWGLDADDRSGDPTHSLSWAIDRLLLGLVLPPTPGLAPGGVAPWSAPGHPERTGRWLHLLTRLRHWLQELRGSRACSPWCDVLRQLLPDLFGDGGTCAWELPLVLAVIDDWQRIAAGCGRPLEVAVAVAVLEEGLSADSGRFGHRSGALTISALEPMRAIPHRVIVLMGLDAAAFPRQRHRPGFHLMESRRRLGDPAPADQDRYVLLEALLSARDHLLLSWSSRDDRTGEDLQPATGVRQWLEWLQERLGEASGSLMVAHATGPLDHANFLPQGGRPSVSCDRRLLDARRRLDRQAVTPPRALARMEAPPSGAASLPLTPFEDLRRWLMTPQRHWLAQLGLRPREREHQLEDLEALEGDERLRSGLLRRRIAEVDPGDPAAAESGPTAPEDWIQHTRGQGLLPPGAAAPLEARILQERWLSLRDSLSALGPACREPVAWGAWRSTPERRGEQVVLIHPGRESVLQRMDLWIHLLLTAAADPQAAPRQGVLIARDRNTLRPVHRLSCPPPAEARRELERLAALREDWRATCWPVPPRTGMAFLEAELGRAGGGADAAAGCWEGAGPVRAEREEAEMVLCFGPDRPVEEILTAGFAPLAEALYRPLLAAAA